MNYTIQIEKGERLFVASVKELPGVYSQGKTKKQAKKNIHDAIKFFLEDTEND